MDKTLIEQIKAAAIRSVRTFFQTAVGAYLLAFTGLIPGLKDLGSWEIISAALAAGILAMIWNISEELGKAPYPRG